MARVKKRDKTLDWMKYFEDYAKTDTQDIVKKKSKIDAHTGKSRRCRFCGELLKYTYFFCDDYCTKEFEIWYDKDGIAEYFYKAV